MKKSIVTLSLLTLGYSLINPGYSQLGTWTKVTNLAPHDNMGVMVLLTDATVICHNSTGGTTKGGGIGTGWDRLTPDIHGSYINGTWSTIASMHDDRYCFASWNYPDGKVFVAGGEYGTGATKGEVYDPVANTWSTPAVAPSSQNMYDCNGEILADGRVLIGAQDGLHPSYDNFFYSESTNSFATAPICVSPYNHDEAAWLKLPDGSILFVGIYSTASCRYIPGSNTWVADATVPVALYDAYGEESGPAFLLPNGKAIFFGATGHNAIYTPSGTSSPGTWTAAPDFPKVGTKQMGQVDAPGAMLPNGEILLAVCPINTSSSQQFLAPTWFFEYDYVSNTFTKVTAKISVPGFSNDSIPLMSSENSTFLLLPDGSVLEGINQTAAYTSTDYSNQYYIFTPTGSPIAAGQPTISSVSSINCTTYTIKGTLFNGISEGAAYGDDWQMATNWPIVRLTNGTSVYYCKTTNWNRIGAVMTGSAIDSANFTLPVSLPAGTYSLVVIANGNPSAPVSFTPCGSSCNLTTTASVTQNVLCSGGSTGSASASPASGTTPYTYTWSNGGTNSSVTGLSAGTYTITVKDKNACSATASVTISQPTALTVATSSTSITCNGSNNGIGSTTVSGGTSPYTYSWAPGGGTSSSKTGLSAGTYSVTVTDHAGCNTIKTITITQPTLLRDSISSSKCTSGKGKATVGVKGGTSPYTYSWSPGGGTKATMSGLTSNSYTITVTDKKGCSKSVTVTFTCVAAPGGGLEGEEQLTDPDLINIYPNPTNGKFSINGLTNGMMIEMYDYTGRKLSVISCQSSVMELNLSNQANGIYLIRILNSDGTLVSQKKLVKTN